MTMTTVATSMSVALGVMINSFEDWNFNGIGFFYRNGHVPFDRDWDGFFDSHWNVFFHGIGYFFLDMNGNGLDYLYRIRFRDWNRNWIGLRHSNGDWMRYVNFDRLSNWNTCNQIQESKGDRNLCQT